METSVRYFYFVFNFGLVIFSSMYYLDSRYSVVKLTDKSYTIRSVNAQSLM